MSSDDDTQQAPRRPLEAWERPWWSLLMKFVDLVGDLRTDVRTGTAAPTGGTTQYFGKIRGQYNLLSDDPLVATNPRDILIMSGMDDFFRLTQKFWEGTVRDTLKLDLPSTDVEWAWLTTNGGPDRWKSSTPDEKSIAFQNLRRRCQNIRALITTLLDKFQKSRPLQYFVSCEFGSPGDIQTKRYVAVQNGIKLHIGYLTRLLNERLPEMLIETVEGRDVSTFNWTSSAARRDGPSGAVGEIGVGADLQGMRLLLAVQ